MVIKTQAQNVGIGTSTPNASAQLDISSNNKGLLIPRMSSSQRNAIVAPAKGLMAFDSSQNSFWYYTGSGWKELGGNIYNSDSSLVVGKQSGTIPSHILTFNTSSSDSSGYLYDSGGTAGNYGNNENFTYNIYLNSYLQIATDIIVLSNDLESPYDSLIISDNNGHRYVLLGTTTGSYRLFGNVKVQFKSNFANTATGFAIRWNGIFPGTDNNYNANQTTGWYYNPSKNYMRGGVNINNNWSPDSSGMYSFAFGNNNKVKGLSAVSFGNTTLSDGDYSISIGNYSKAIGISSIALGSNSNAAGDFSLAAGINSIASGYCSTAIGYYSSASEEFNTAIGLFTKSKSYGGFVTGLYNDSTNAASSNSINSLNRIFQIGNGTAEYARSNAMTVLQNGNVGIGTVNPIAPLNFASSLGDKIIMWTNGTTHYGMGVQPSLLQIYSESPGTDIAFGTGRSDAFTENVRFKGNGNVGIGITSPLTLLDVNGDASFNDKTILLRNGGNPYHGLRYDSNVDGPYLFGYNGGALGTSGLPNSLTWDWNGNVSVLSNLTVKNGKGIIRSTDGTQKKELSTNVIVNVSLAVGASTSINFTFPESFSASPDVYLGNVVGGAGGWAEVIMTIANVSTTGGTLYVHNSTNGTWNPNFTVKVIAIGPQ
jgi:hypothetical protein